MSATAANETVLDLILADRNARDRERILSEFRNPDWSRAYDGQNESPGRWEYHIPEGARLAWPQLSEDARLLGYMLAHEAADRYYDY